MIRRFLYLLYGIVLFSIGCQNDHQGHKMANGDAYYTCPMHPTVHSSTPGACPVCNMSLIKVEIKNTEHQKENTVVLNHRQQLLAGIEVDTLHSMHGISTTTILGTVSADEEQVKTISSRIKGRIDKLFFKTTGDYIQVGSPIYSIYSEQLLADEKEYIGLYRQKKSSNTQSKLLGDMFSAAKNKLKLWGLTEIQIAELENKMSASALMTFYAQTSGYVIEAIGKEGIYVEEGTPLLKLNELSQVWVEAQVYSEEVEKIKDAKAFYIYTKASPNEMFKGNLVYNNPIIEKESKIYLVRIRVDNLKGKLIPGMMVYVSPEKSEKLMMAIPKSAVLPEKMKTAWVKTNETTFEQRMLETGIENKLMIEVLSGLNEGDAVVTTGAYLINSEFILKSGSSKRHEH